MIDKIKNLLNKQVIIGGIILALLLCFLVLVLQVGIFPYLDLGPGKKANLEITPLTTQAAIGTTAATIESTAVPEDLPGVISLGMTVQITGTGQDGLRMRADAGTDQTVLFLANEGDLFTIVDGPVIRDSLIWWKIQALDDAHKSGWSVQDYLLAVQL
jgi:hypothetical protein